MIVSGLNRKNMNIVNSLQYNLQFSFFLHVSHVDVTGAVSSRISDLMSKDRTPGLVSKVNTEVVVELHSTILGVHVDHQHHRAFVAHVRVELFVPGREERGGHVKSLSVKTELKHLRCAPDPLLLDISHPGLDGELRVLGDRHRTARLDGSSEEDLAGELGVPGVGDVVLSHVSVDPVREVKILVVHTDQDISHHPGHIRQDPAINFLGWDVNHLLCSPVSGLCLVVPEHVGEQSRAYESLRSFRVMQEPDLQGHHALKAQVNLLDQLLLFPVVNIQMSPVVAFLHISNVQTSEEGPGMSPLSGDHDVMVRLVPEVVTKLRLVLLAGGPRRHRLESLPVQQDEAALPVLAGAVSQGGDHHVAVRQTVGGVRGAHTEGVHLPGLNDLVQPGVAGVRLDVHNVDPVGAQGRHDQPRPGPGGVVETGTAGVPAGVVDLVTNVGEVEARDHLGVGRALGVNIHCGHIVRPVLVRDDAGKIDNLLTGPNLKSLPWSGVAGSTSIAGHCVIPNRINCEELQVRWFCPGWRWRYFYPTEFSFVWKLETCWTT